MWGNYTWVSSILMSCSHPAATLALHPHSSGTVALVSEMTLRMQGSKNQLTYLCDIQPLFLGIIRRHNLVALRDQWLWARHMAHGHWQP